MPKIIEPAAKKRKLEYDNQPSTSQNQPTKKTIVLNQNINKNYTVNWLGVNKKENTNEEPLVLNFDDQDFYFYSNNIKTIPLRWSKIWISYRNKLDKNQQEKLLKAYEKKFDQNNLFQQFTLLTLKLNHCFSFFKNLNKKNILLNYRIFKYKNQTDEIKQEINSFQNDNTIDENWENTLIKITDYNNRLDSLNYNQQLALQETTKTIKLNQSKNYSINWFGVSKKENTNEEPLILNFDNQDYYFYSNNIDYVEKKTKKNWINYQFKLDKNTQKKIFEAYEKIMDQNNLFQQNLLEKLKTIYYISVELSKKTEKNIKNLNQPSTSKLTTELEPESLMDIIKKPTNSESTPQIDFNWVLDMTEEPSTSKLTPQIEPESIMDIIKKPTSLDSIPAIDFDWVLDITEKPIRKEKSNPILNTFINSSENLEIDDNELNL